MVQMNDDITTIPRRQQEEKHKSWEVQNAELTTEKLIVANVHVMQILLSYLSRKQKIALRLVCKSFGEAVAFKSLVSLRF